MRDNPLEVQLEAIRLFPVNGGTRRAIVEQLGINDESRIDKWLTKYCKFGEEALRPRKPTSPGSKLDRPLKVELHARYVAWLEIENSLLIEFHTDFRDVQLAQRDFGRSTTIRKTTK